MRCRAQAQLYRGTGRWVGVAAQFASPRRRGSWVARRLDSERKCDEPAGCFLPGWRAATKHEVTQCDTPSSPAPFPAFSTN
ncbi:hypothetical protein BDA96_10G085900 [Sorghum bicolor]|uniref:Uncharacterized protein n=1 Tax=Sorghum bicolor TaxID=4558 RepID=A0A921U049_SORBI|nr:hypothetical protein BDA96_10G085900 [Sorghum bicolor]